MNWENSYKIAFYVSSYIWSWIHPFKFAIHLTQSHNVCCNENEIVDSIFHCVAKRLQISAVHAL